MTTVAALDFGSCDKFDKMRDPTAQNHTALGGLWYEYVFSPRHQGSVPYDCATWNLLYHATEADGPRHVYDLLHHAFNKTTEQTWFNQRAYTCGRDLEGHSCEMEYVDGSSLAAKAAAAVTNPTVEIVDTDTYSYAVLQFCNSYGVAH